MRTHDAYIPIDGGCGTRNIRKTFTIAALAVTTLLVTSSAMASADPASLTASTGPTPVTPVSRALTEMRDERRLGISRLAIPQADNAGKDSGFHPDYSRALTPDQMNAAWNAEIDRVFETPVTGGG